MVSKALQQWSSEYSLRVTMLSDAIAGAPGSQLDPGGGVATVPGWVVSCEFDVSSGT